MNGSNTCVVLRESEKPGVMFLPEYPAPLYSFFFLFSGSSQVLSAGAFLKQPRRNIKGNHHAQGIAGHVSG